MDELYQEEKHRDAKDYKDKGSDYEVKSYPPSEYEEKYLVADYLTDYYPFERNAFPLELPRDYSTPEEFENGTGLSTLLGGVHRSLIHGDVDTPILKVEECTSTVVKVAHVGDSNRKFAFHLTGLYLIDLYRYQEIQANLKYSIS